MSKKSFRVVLTLLGSGAFASGCSHEYSETKEAAFTSQIDLEQDHDPLREQDTPQTVTDQNSAGSTSPVEPGSAKTQTRHSHYRGSSMMWPLLWMMSSRSHSSYNRPPISGRGLASPSSPRYSPAGTGGSVPVQSTAGSVNAHGFGKTGRAISGGS
jgi:hypothetical protein